VSPKRIGGIPKVVAVDRDQSYGLHRDEELAEGLRRAAAGRAERALERLRAIAAAEADTADAVHGTRKDMKKMRTVLRLVRDRLPKRAYREQNRRFRDASRLLSATRDAEVKLGTLGALAEGAGDLPEAAVESWRLILESEREAATNAARDEPALAAAAAEIEAGLTAVEAWPLEGDSWGLVGDGLERAYRRGRRAMRAAAAEGGEADFHEWRKRAKDLWYGLRLLEAAWPAVLTPTAEEVHRLSELLGDHHDLAVLREDLHARRLGKEESRALEAVIDAREEELAAAAFDLGRRLYAERSKPFARRLRGYWKAWRG
jgi:CHAD domain-containing protein